MSALAGQAPPRSKPLICTVQYSYYIRMETLGTCHRKTVPYLRCFPCIWHRYLLLTSLMRSARWPPAFSRHRDVSQPAPHHSGGPWWAGAWLSGPRACTPPCRGLRALSSSRTEPASVGQTVVSPMCPYGAWSQPALNKHAVSMKAQHTGNQGLASFSEWCH